MITEGFDQRTLANMEIALERACANISGAEKHRARRYIADRIIKCARKGNRTLEALTQAGQIAADELRKRANAKAEVKQRKRSSGGPAASAATGGAGGAR